MLPINSRSSPRPTQFTVRGQTYEFQWGCGNEKLFQNMCLNKSLFYKNLRLSHLSSFVFMFKNDFCNLFVFAAFIYSIILY